jgi:hypothetical protein
MALGQREEDTYSRQLEQSVIARDLVIENSKIAKLQDRRLGLIEQILRFRLRISAEGFARLRLAYAFKPPQLGFFGNPGDFGNFLYLLWLLGV